MTISNVFITKVLTSLKSFNWSYKIYDIPNNIPERITSMLSTESKYFPINLNSYKANLTQVFKKIIIQTSEPSESIEIMIAVNYLKKNNKLIQQILDFIVLVLYIFQTVFKRKENTFKIVLYLLEGKKQFPKGIIKKGQFITSKYVNSGVTLSYDKEQVVVIYRREEILKVLIHELLHLHKTHPNTQYESFYDEKIKKTNNIINYDSLNVYEAYVELCALFLNTIIYTYKHNEKCKIKDVIKNLEKEKKYSQKIVNDIYTLLDNRPLKEKTNVYSYYFIKLSFLQNLDMFFNSIDLYDYTIYDSKKYFENINKSLIKLKINKSKHVSSSSMKMTCLDILKPT
jgi:hypothetical protein